MVEVAFHLVVHRSSTCPPTSAHPCTLVPGSTPCCLLAGWEAQGVGDPLIPALGCPLNSLSTARGSTLSTALPYQVEGVPEGHPMGP